MDRTPVKSIIDGNFFLFIFYFPYVKERSAQLDWVRNQFIVSESNRGKFAVSLQEPLLDVASDRGLQMKFEGCTLTQFWVSVKKGRPELGQNDLEQLLPFGSTYLCETFFSAMTQIKTKQRNRKKPHHSSGFPTTKIDENPQ